jgi:hypothetical protein
MSVIVDQKQAERLARAFRDVLSTWLTHAQWLEMQRRNVSNGFLICASHDFCDANEAMAMAFLQTMGRDILPDDAKEMAEADMALWNAAWDIAKRRYLTAKTR